MCCIFQLLHINIEVYSSTLIIFSLLHWNTLCRDFSLEIFLFIELKIRKRFCDEFGMSFSWSLKRMYLPMDLSHDNAIRRFTVRWIRRTSFLTANSTDIENIAAESMIVLHCWYRCRMPLLHLTALVMFDNCR